MDFLDRCLYFYFKVFNFFMFSHFLFTFYKCLTFSNLISSVIYLDQAFSLEHFLIACWDAFHYPPEDINEVLFLKFLLLLFSVCSHFAMSCFVSVFCVALIIYFCSVLLGAASRASQHQGAAAAVLSRLAQA